MNAWPQSDDPPALSGLTMASIAASPLSFPNRLFIRHSIKLNGSGGVSDEIGSVFLMSPCDFVQQRREIPYFDLFLRRGFACSVGRVPRDYHALVVVIPKTVLL